MCALNSVTYALNKTQPMDKEVIQALKYRKRPVQFTIAQVDKDKTLTGPEILKKISVMEAIYWINRSWREVGLFIWGFTSLSTLYRSYHDG